MNLLFLNDQFVDLILFLCIVEGGHKAIIFSRLSGIKPNVHGEGLKFKIPWVEREIIYHVRALNKQFTCHTGSKGNEMDSYKYFFVVFLLIL